MGKQPRPRLASGAAFDPAPVRQASATTQFRPGAGASSTHTRGLTFAEALRFQMNRFGDRQVDVAALAHPRRSVLIGRWLRTTLPGDSSFPFLLRLERRYGLKVGYFVRRVLSDREGRKALKAGPVRREGVHHLAQHIRDWHTPGNLAELAPSQREAHEAWLRDTFTNAADRGQGGLATHRNKPYAFDLAAGTEFLKARGMSTRYAPQRLRRVRRTRLDEVPPRLLEEWNDLIDFKTAPVCRLGWARDTVWNSRTIHMRAGTLGRLFGALGTKSHRRRRGWEIPHEHLTLGVLVFPAVWHAFISALQDERGYLTNFELEALSVAHSLNAPVTGWLRQNSALSDRLEPLPGLISAEDIEVARRDWDAASQRCFQIASSLRRDVARVRRSAREPFEPILTVLEDPNPLKTYARIVDEIRIRNPPPTPGCLRSAQTLAEIIAMSVALHTGFRQRNIRQLLLQRKDRPVRSEQELVRREAGEIRYVAESGEWRIYMPRQAFKNANSPFFRHGGLMMTLPRIPALHEALEAWVSWARPLVLGASDDPETLLVRRSEIGAIAFEENSFYAFWRKLISKYGIYNPWTGRGAIEGLRLHGPHAVRAIRATQVLKMTGSIELAAHAIQDLPLTVEKHYGRFLPHDKMKLVQDHLDVLWR